MDSIKNNDLTNNGGEQFYITENDLEISTSDFNDICDVLSGRCPPWGPDIYLGKLASSEILLTLDITEDREPYARVFLKDNNEKSVLESEIPFMWLDSCPNSINDMSNLVCCTLNTSIAENGNYKDFLIKSNINSKLAGNDKTCPVSIKQQIKASLQASTPNCKNSQSMVR